MTDLLLHGREQKTVFDLLGDKENDITFSLGWALARCNGFLKLLLRSLLPGCDTGEAQAIHLQRSDKAGGHTDVEILAERAHVVIEAKRGWNLPFTSQLERYSQRFADSLAENLIVIIAECTKEYAQSRLPPKINGIPVHYLRWQQVAQIAGRSLSSANHADKRLLRELQAYLKGLMTMQNQQSNLVFVVVLSSATPSWSQISWRDMVRLKKRYFHPFGVLGWPKEPPNYIGFRYNGKLQSFHHVDNYRILSDVSDMSLEIPEIDGARWRAVDKNAHFLYTLGPAIVPPGEVKTGKLWSNGRFWAALDLLLTCQTIAEAIQLTHKRRQIETD